MSNKSALVFGCLLFSLTLAARLEAQTQNATISGTVMDSTGAVLAGRRTVEQVDHWGGNHHGVPIFVPSHRPPGPSVASYPLVTYVSDGIASAMAQAPSL